MEKNFYQILEVGQGEGQDGIKKAYRRLSKKYHPDANPGDRKAEARFREISEAYAVLQDKEKRSAYDRELKGKKTGEETAAETGGGKAPGRRSGPVDIDFGNMPAGFEQFFGFNPKTGEINKDKMKQDKKTSANPLDMTDLFERYMGIKK